MPRASAKSSQTSAEQRYPDQTHHCVVSTKLSQVVSTLFMDRPLYTRSVYKVGHRSLASVLPAVFPDGPDKHWGLKVFSYPHPPDRADWEQQLWRASHLEMSLLFAQARWQLFLPGVVARGKRCFFSSKSVLLYWLRHFNFSLVFLRNASLMEALILVSTLPGEMLTIIDLNRPSPHNPVGRWERRFYRLSRLWFSARRAALSKSRTRWLKERKQGRGSSRGPNLRWASDQRENRGGNRLLHYFLLMPFLCHKANTP